MYIVKYKKYRSDKQLWEECRVIFKFIKYFKYSIFKNGKLHKHWKLFPYPNPTYMGCNPLSNPTIGRKTFETEYKSNIYLVPLDYQVDLDKD